MSTRKTTLFYAVLIAIASIAVGMVIASRLDLTPASSAQTVSRAADEQRAARRRRSTRRRSGTSPRRRSRRSSTSGPSRAQRSRGPDRVLRRRRAATICCGGSSAGDAPARSPARRAAAAAAARRQDDAGPLHAGRRHRLHHRQGRLHPHEQPRGRRGGQDPVSFVGAERNESVRGQGRRPRHADRQRADPADRDAVDSRCRKRSSATRRRCSRATGSWRSATRSASATR